jgi:hypothetical protein
MKQISGYMLKTLYDNKSKDYPISLKYLCTIYEEMRNSLIYKYGTFEEDFGEKVVGSDNEEFNRELKELHEKMFDINDNIYEVYMKYDK